MCLGSWMPAPDPHAAALQLGEHRGSQAAHGATPWPGVLGLPGEEQVSAPPYGFVGPFAAFTFPWCVSRPSYPSSNPSVQPHRLASILRNGNLLEQWYVSP